MCVGVKGRVSDMGSVGLVGLCLDDFLGEAQLKPARQATLSLCLPVSLSPTLSLPPPLSLTPWSDGLRH